jgi:hypothetical protein
MLLFGAGTIGTDGLGPRECGDEAEAAESDLTDGKVADLREDELTAADGNGGFALAEPDKDGFETPPALGDAAEDGTELARVFLSEAPDEEASGGGGGATGRAPVALAR